MHLPLSDLREDFPGIGGRLKQTPEDFVVEEIPAYVPCGDGEHLFLWIEKRDISGGQLQRHVADTLGLSPHDIGTAGIKDRQAVTRQYVSVPASAESRIDELSRDGVTLLDARRHGNKLKTGHLRGNRFTVRVRDPEHGDEEAVGGFVSRLAAEGFPNYFGDQRFGRDDETLAMGLDLLRGLRDAKTLKRHDKFLLRLALSSAQSMLFNEVLADRTRDGLMRSVLLGDVMQKVVSGGPFVVQDVAVEQPRFDAWETVISGPIFGPKMKRPEAVPQQREQAALDRFELNDDNFRLFPKLTSGTRRPMLVRPDAMDVAFEADSIVFRFSLPSGCYATVLLEQLMRREP